MPKDFGFVFRYGVEERNVLNTMDQTFTKDLIAKGTITTKLVFTEADLLRVYRFMKEIDIISYPQFLAKAVRNHVMIQPRCVESFRIRMKGIDYRFGQKCFVDPDTGHFRDFRSLVDTVLDILEKKEEYKKLPQAEGGYL